MTTRHRKVIWTEKSLQYLKDQVDYVLERDEEAAVRVAKRLREAGNDLGRPAIGRSRQGNRVLWEAGNP